MYSPAVVSRPGTPLLTRLARRQAGALALMRTNPVRAQNRLSHIAREADAAGITHKQITAEIARLTAEREAARNTNTKGN